MNWLLHRNSSWLYHNWRLLLNRNRNRLNHWSLLLLWNCSRLNHNWRLLLNRNRNRLNHWSLLLLWNCSWLNWILYWYRNLLHNRLHNRNSILIGHGVLLYHWLRIHYLLSLLGLNRIRNIDDIWLLLLLGLCSLRLVYNNRLGLSRWRLSGGRILFRLGLRLLLGWRYYILDLRWRSGRRSLRFSHIVIFDFCYVWLDFAWFWYIHSRRCYIKNRLGHIDLRWSYVYDRRCHINNRSWYLNIG